MQLRTRVLAGVLAVTLVTLVGFGAATVTALHEYLLSQTDADLQTVLNQYQPPAGAPGMLSDQVSAPVQRAPAAEKQRRSARVEQRSARVVIPAVLDKYGIELETGRGPATPLVLGNPNLVPRLPADLAALATDHRAQTVTSRIGHAELRLLAASADGATLIVTTSLAGLNGTIGRLELIVAVGVLAAALLVLAAIALVVRRGLRPVETMAAAADKISAGDLTSRVSPHDPATEVGRLGAALNGMLARIHAAVREREASEQATRQFFADASHELRTPLASLRANAELYEQGALPDRTQVDEAMHRIASEAKRMGNLVDDMLRLARLGQHPHQHHRPVDLTTLAGESVQRARIASPQHAWQAHIAPSLVTTGDEELLRRALDNLLANIIAHTPAGTTATITATAGDNGSVTIDVSDDGPGVRNSQIPRIFDRFYRAPAQTYRPGSGLGLAIVAAIAADHNGTVHATANHPNGLRVTLTLPEADQFHPAPQPRQERVPADECRSHE